MNWDAVGATAETIGAVAVLATLAYLAVQVRASTRSTRSQTLLGSSIQYQQLLVQPTNSGELSSALQKSGSGEQLTPSERTALQSWCVAMASFLSSTWTQAEMGAFGEGGAGAEYQGLIDVIRTFVESPPFTLILTDAEVGTFYGRELIRHDKQLREFIAAVSPQPESAV